MVRIVCIWGDASKNGVSPRLSNTAPQSSKWSWQWSPALSSSIGSRFTASCRAPSPLGAGARTASTITSGPPPPRRFLFIGPWSQQPPTPLTRSPHSATHRSTMRLATPESTLDQLSDESGPLFTVLEESISRCCRDGGSAVVDTTRQLQARVFGIRIRFRTHGVASERRLHLLDAAVAAPSLYPLLMQSPPYLHLLLPNPVSADTHPFPFPSPSPPSPRRSWAASTSPFSNTRPRSSPPPKTPRGGPPQRSSLSPARACRASGPP